MLYLQKQGCHNINLVTPTHVVPNILKALDIAVDHGLNIPLIYNCSGYECLETLGILKNIMSQYHPMGDAITIKELSRCLTPDEFRRALDMAKQFNLEIIR